MPISKKCQGREIKPTTLAKYKTFTNQLLAYSDGKGHRRLEIIPKSWPTKC